MGHGHAGRTGWPAVVACFSMALFAWGFGFYGQGVFLAALQRIHGWPASLVSGAITLHYVVGALFLAFVPEAQNRLGRRAAIVIGIGVMAGSVALLPLVTTIPQLFVVQVAMAAGWALTGSTAIANVLGPWFDRRRGLAISIALNGASVAGFTVTPLLIKAIDSHGFAHGTWLAAAVSALLAATLVVVLVRPPSASWLDAERSRPADPSSPRRRDPGPLPAPLRRREVFASRRYWLITLPFGFGLLAQVGFLVHQVAFLLPTLGVDGTGFAIALTTGGALVGRVAMAAFVDRLDRRSVAAASFALQAAALGAMLIWPAAPVLYGGCFLIGLALGNANVLPALIVLDEFAAGSFGVVVGLVTAFNQFLYAFGPLTLGILRDATGGYAVPVIACMILMTGAAILVLAGRPTTRG
ncbi:MFS transporter [Enterovirga rhinocerotis]|uniref:Cyanate permease n=1 Tax=Enterovirga rhinocerotis TaxID=1339210 RepID=A0A4R7BZY4_9HYPH|nr:MFS transporter [Enterovirga rhinocerotis]TDR89676.1 cyanate permease [Enterovirga rhinocerotis]